jgi:hypothetical protein
VRRFIVPCVVAVVVVACGGADTALTPHARQTLAPLVRDVRAAAESYQPAAMEQALAELRRSVSELSAADELSEGRAEQIRASAAVLEARITLVPTTTTTTTTVSELPREGDHPGKGKGKEPK